jgi:hypothetical protein
LLPLGARAPDIALIAQAPVIQQIFVIGLPSEIPAPVPAHQPANW